MARLRHVEIWSTWSFAAGATRLGAVLYTIRGGRTTRRVGGERQKSCQVAMGDVTAPDGSEARQLADAFAEIRPNRVLRFVLSDDSWSEWLVLDVDDASDGDGFATLTLAGLSAALQRVPAVRLVDADGRATFRFDGVGLTLAQHWDNYFTPRLSEAGLTFVVLGTDESSGAKDLAYDAEDPWAGAKALAEAFGLEIDISRDDGSSTYRVHFVTKVGAGLTGPRLAAPENAAIQRKRSVVPQRTRLDGVGAEGCTIGDAVWVVASKVGNVLGLADPAGGPGPLLTDDQLTGLYLEAADRTTRTQITSGVAGLAQTVTVASGTAFTVGDRVRFRADAIGTRLVALTDPAAVAAHGVLAGVYRREDIAETVNLIPNADMALWTGASNVPPDGWAAVGSPTLTRNTTAQHLQTGGKSCRVQTTADGQGLATPLVTIAPTALAPYGSGFLNYKLISGKVRLELVVTNGTSTWILPDGISQKAVPENGKIGIFDLLGASGIDLKSLGATAARLRMVQDGAGTAEFYVDAGQLTESGGQLPLVIGAGPTQLWQAVNDQLALVAPTSVRLEGRPVDFYRLDEAAYPYHRFLLGASHDVVVPRLGLVDGVRVLEIAEEDDTEAQTSLVLSSLPEDLRSLQQRRVPTRSATVSGPTILSGVRTITDAQSLSPNGLLSTSAGFSAADVGKTIWILGAGPSGVVLKTTIASQYGPAPTLRVILTDNISVATTGLTAIIGPADEVATVGATIGGGRAGGVLGDDTGKLRPAAKDWQSRALDRFFAKLTSGDGDVLDSVPDGSTYLKVIPFLTIKAEVTASTATTMTVTITATDPSGGAAPTVAHNGGGAVSGSGPYTITKPAAGSGDLGVTFTASKTGRVSQAVTVTVPAQSGGGTVPPSIDAFYVTSENQSTNVLSLAHTVSNPPAGYSLDLQWSRTGSDGGNFGNTISGISTTSPYSFDTDLQDGTVDIVAKFTSGYEAVTYRFTLLLKNSGGTVVATATCTYDCYVVITP